MPSTKQEPQQLTGSARPEPKPVTLALQGGGSHGALTWGVLDRFLEDERLAIRAISGTSAGAMNAVVLADGLAKGGREGARTALRNFWKAVSDSARFSPIRRSFWDKVWGNYSLDHSPGYLFMESLSRVFSPYDLNPKGVNPLRSLLAEHVDFDNVNSGGDLKVYVTATNVRTGRARVFAQGEVTVDAVLASACLPQMFPAVEIDGEAYWDGGFTGNPALYPLVTSTDSPDILVVQINPIVRQALPRSARDILNRVNEISFNSSLIKELRTIGLLQKVAEAKGLDLGTYTETYLHLIHADMEVQDLVASSKLNAEWDYLELLFQKGRKWADAWLAENFEHVGYRSTLDLDAMFGDTHLPSPQFGMIAPVMPTAPQQKVDLAEPETPEPVLTQPAVYEVQAIAPQAAEPEQDVFLPEALETVTPATPEPEPQPRSEEQSAPWQPEPEWAVEPQYTYDTNAAQQNELFATPDDFTGLPHEEPASRESTNIAPPEPEDAEPAAGTSLVDQPVAQGSSEWPGEIAPGSGDDTAAYPEQMSPEPAAYAPYPDQVTQEPEGYNPLPDQPAPGAFEPERTDPEPTVVDPKKRPSTTRAVASRSGKTRSASVRTARRGASNRDLSVPDAPSPADPETTT